MRYYSNPLHDLIRDASRKLIVTLLRRSSKSTFCEESILNAVFVEAVLYGRVYNDYLLERIIQTGIGNVKIKVVKVKEKS